MHQKNKKHKGSMLVFSVLRVLVVVVLLRQISLHNYEGAFLCVLTLVLLYLPCWIQSKVNVELPQPLEITILCFIFSAEILGEVNAFYIKIPEWDSILHMINGFLMAAVGFSMAMLLNRHKKAVFALSPLFLAVTAFCFSMTIGAMWEFFEFGMDSVFHTDMQKDTVVKSIYSVALDETHSNKVVSLEEIKEVAVNGEDMELGGYLDIGLIDTMKDLFVNFIGAIVYSFIGFLCISKKSRMGFLLQAFVPRKRAGTIEHNGSTHYK